METQLQASSEAKSNNIIQVDPISHLHLQPPSQSLGHWHFESQEAVVKNPHKQLKTDQFLHLQLFIACLWVVIHEAGVQYWKYCRIISHTSVKEMLHSCQPKLTTPDNLNKELVLAG